MKRTAFTVLILLLACTAYLAGYTQGPYKTSCELADLRRKADTLESTVGWGSQWLDRHREADAYETAVYLHNVRADIMAGDTNEACNFLRYKIDSYLLYYQVEWLTCDSFAFRPTSDKWFELIANIAEFRKQNPTPYDSGYPWLHPHIGRYDQRIDAIVYDVAITMNEEKTSNKTLDDTSQ